MLGLHIQSDSGELQWTWAVSTPYSLPVMMQQTIFLVQGKLVGHFPICRWLRVVTAYVMPTRLLLAGMMKQTTPPHTHIRSMLIEMLTRIQQDDNVRGDWCVDVYEFSVWVDASSLATGVALEANGSVVEDASWLCTANNG